MMALMTDNTKDTFETREKPTISVVLMVRDEKPNMKAFFGTVDGVVDELVVVDTGSTDGTVEEVEMLARAVSFPVRVFHFLQAKFHDGQTREYATAQCRGDYILQLDADELFSDDFKKHIKNFLRDKKPQVVTIPRVDELVPHLIDVMDYRLFKKGANAHYGTKDTPHDAVHSGFRFSGTATAFPYPIYHMQGRNHWLRRPHRIFGQLAREIEEVPNTRGLFREFFRGILGFYYKFKKVYFNLETRKDGRAGFKFAFLKGLYAFLGHIFIGLKPREPKK